MSLLEAIAPSAMAEGLRLIVVADTWQAEKVAAGVVGAAGVCVAVSPAREGFLRRTPWLRALLSDQAADLYYSAHYLLDRRCPVPFVLTIHDLTRLRFPDLTYTNASFVERFGASELELLRADAEVLASGARYSRADGQAFPRYFRELTQDLAQRAIRLVASSDTTSLDIQTEFGIRPDRIDVIRVGVDTAIFNKRPPHQVAAVRTRFGLNGPYCMFVGLTHPHKRLPWLLRAVLGANGERSEGVQLALVGGFAEEMREVRDLLAEYQDASIVFTGAVGDDDLACLYTGASALLVASMNEGTNLLALEALACGCEVVATDIAAMREGLHARVHFYDPGVPEQLGALATRASSGRLKRRAPGFVPPTWTLSGRQLVLALAEAAADAHSSRADLGGSLDS
jgi:glycosyltransferase involved in cell wall biosynthesis